MATAPQADDRAGPVELRNPAVRTEVARAAIWLGMALGLALAVLLIRPILVILFGIVIASMLDGGVRLLGRVLPIGRGWRLLIVVLGVVAFLVATFVLTGVQVAQQVTQLRSTLEGQATHVTGWLSSKGMMPAEADLKGFAQRSLGRVSGWVGTAADAAAHMFMILVIGLFLAASPGVYERGLEWMVPRRARPEFTLTLNRMGATLRRLMAGRLTGMALEGVFTAVALWLGGVPMALLLGILAGVLAFIPNVGAFVTGVLMVAVGFSGGVHTGVWAIVTYVLVQAIDGYVIAPTVAKRTVDLPPALTLSVQILAGTLFGILGLALADPFTALAKTALERSAERNEQEEAATA